MSLLQNIAGGLRGLFHKERAEQELDEELRGYVDAAAAAKAQAGMSAEAALRAARLELGGVEAVKEKVRAAGWERALEALWQDLRFGVRLLRKSLGFTIVALLTLALGIGANTAVFSVVNAVLLRPLSAPEPGRVVVFMSSNPQGSSSLGSEIKFNVWREQTSVLQDVAAYRPGSFILTGGDQPQKAYGIFVTEDYFRLFGIPLVMGRSFDAEEERPDAGNFVVLSNAFWKRAFDGDPQILGKTIPLNGNGYQVIGVLGGNIHMENIGPANGPMVPDAVPDVWVPFPIDPNSGNQNHYFQAVARLKPGITLDAANAQLQLATQEFRRKFPKGLSTSRGDVFSVEPFLDLLVKNIRFSFLILASAVIFVLLMSCANVAGLLLTRATSRTHEMAIRTALGASRARIVRQLLTESVLLSGLGAALGLGIGFAGIHALLALNPYDIPRIGVNAANITMNWQVLLFTTVVALSAGILFGLLPALQASRTDLSTRLKESGGRIGTAFRQNRARSLLMIGETGLALVLLIGAVLFIRALIAVRSVSPGFDPRDVVTTRMTLDPLLAKTSTIDQIIQKAVLRVGALPGVETVASTNLLPLEGMFASLPITVAGRPVNGPSPIAGHGNSRFVTISSGYFDALKIPLIRGRLFADSDRAGTPGVAIINQAMARRFWPDGDPLNAQIFLGKGLGPNFDEPARQVVGIVADVHDDELDRDPESAVFVPIGQRLMAQTTTVDRTWVIRVRTPSPSLDAAIQNELRQALGSPAPPLRSMEDVAEQSTGRQDFNARLLTAFGCAALIIAAIGTYGLTAYAAEQRTREIAIRMAVGAQKMQILRTVIGAGLMLAVAGVCMGVVSALALTRFLRSLLYGVTPTDPATFFGVIALLLGVALVACYIPARRAARVDPMVALRHE